MPREERNGYANALEADDMKVLDQSPLPYVPSWAMKPHHLSQRMRVYRQRVKEERRMAEENEQRTQRVEEWRG